MEGLHGLLTYHLIRQVTSQYKQRKQMSFDDLEGILYNCGFSANVYGPVFAGLAENLTPDELVGITVFGGVGVGVDVHASPTNTETVVEFNPVEWIKGAWKK